MLTCKSCKSALIVKNGTVRSKARYRCKGCGYNFTQGDGHRRVSKEVVAKKALAVLLYGMGRASFGMIGKVLGVSRSLAYRWIKQEAAQLPEPKVGGEIKEM